MKFSANLSLLYTEYPLLERFNAARQSGFKAVEIQFPYETRLNDLIDMQQKNGLHIVLINVPAGDLMSGGEGLAAVPTKVEEFKAAVDKCTRYAKALNVNAVNILPGRCFDQNHLPQKRSHYLSTLEHNLRYAANTFQAVGVKTTVEAINTQDMPDFLIHNTQQMLDLLAKINHPNLYMQYDIYHMATMEEPVVQQLQQHGKLMGHIQFADTPGRGEPGSGQLDFSEIFSAINSSAYNGWVGAEYRPTRATEASLSWLPS